MTLSNLNRTLGNELNKPFRYCQIQSSPSHHSPTALLLLAAGASRRLGQPKQLLRWGQDSLVRHAAKMTISAHCFPIGVVLGAFYEQVRVELKDLPIVEIPNIHWPEGIHSSLQAGIRFWQAWPTPITATIVMVCDQPFVTVALLQQLMTTYQTSPATIVACDYGETLGVPVLWDCCWFPQLLELGGDRGAQSLIAQHRSAVATVPFPQGAIDIDTPADYQQWLAARLTQND